MLSTFDAAEICAIQSQMLREALLGESCLFPHASDVGPKFFHRGFMHLTVLQRLGSAGPRLISPGILSPIDIC